MPKHIAVLMGGFSAEREVSLSSGKACAEALRELGYDVTEIDVQRDIAEKLSVLKPDIAFNALHGRFGEDGCMQGILEILQIPYTHSGVLASALAMDKPAAKKIFTQSWIRCAEGRVVSKQEMLGGEPLMRPFVVKPSNEGSSVGVTIVQGSDNFFFSETSWPFGEEVLVEEYIPGREVQVAVLDDAALGAIEIVPLSGFYDYEAKYTDGKAKHLMPAPIDADAYEEVMELALRAHRALGCRGLTRTDFRYDDRAETRAANQGRGVFYILETNTQPGMTPLSLSPEIAAHSGITFNQLVQKLVDGAKLGA